MYAWLLKHAQAAAVGQVVLLGFACCELQEDRARKLLVQARAVSSMLCRQQTNHQQSELHLIQTREMMQHKLQQMQGPQLKSSRSGDAWQR